MIIWRVYEPTNRCQWMYYAINNITKIQSIEEFVSSFMSHAEVVVLWIYELLIISLDGGS